jgi:hypothetical protein
VPDAAVGSGAAWNGAMDIQFHHHNDTIMFGKKLAFCGAGYCEYSRIYTVLLLML